MQTGHLGEQEGEDNARNNRMDNAHYDYVCDE